MYDDVNDEVNDEAITKSEFVHLDARLGDDEFTNDILDRIALKIFGQTREQVIDEICID